MSPHLLRRHDGQTEAPPIFAPARALGALERRITRRRGRAAPGSATSHRAPAGSDTEAGKSVNWVGDERDTTQGGW